MDLCQSPLNIKCTHCVSCSSVRGENETRLATICPEKLELATAPQCAALQVCGLLCCLSLCFPEVQSSTKHSGFSSF